MKIEVDGTNTHARQGLYVVKTRVFERLMRPRGMQGFKMVYTAGNAFFF